jgi:bacterioferritin (cytochrome b1)
LPKAIPAYGGAAEFLEHAQDEQQHADRIAERITQLGGAPDFSPDGLAARSHAEYDVAKERCDDQKGDAKDQCQKAAKDKRDQARKEVRERYAQKSERPAASGATSKPKTKEK